MAHFADFGHFDILAHFADFGHFGTFDGFGRVPYLVSACFGPILDPFGHFSHLAIFSVLGHFDHFGDFGHLGPENAGHMPKPNITNPQ